MTSLSPYLLQHAYNPVDWYPWGPEALQKSKTEQKPIFLSIGYSACHWCHVMEHECFEDAEVAAMLNKHFISIKVDREERPDIDEIYMHATVSMTGSGGWPMSVFLTPDCVPFYAGTYFPKQHFLKILNALVDTWENNRARIDQVGAQVAANLRQWGSGATQAEDLIPQSMVHDVATLMAKHFDLELGGIRSDQNKFPPSMAMELMLRTHVRSPNPALLGAVEVTLDRMYRGGIHDHLGGGICRYSTDDRWLVPHFEKMLYDQALVSSIYLDGYQVLGKETYERMARGIFDYVIKDLQSPEGGFYSTRDADSEGLEGKYYIWTKAEIDSVLGAQDAPVFCAYFDVSDAGNWEERFGHAPAGPKNILNMKRLPSDVAATFDTTVSELEQRIAAMKARLLAVREQRVPPGLDDKILTGWNGLMISSLAKGARVLDEPAYALAAVNAAEFVLANMQLDGRLLRTHRRGQSRLTAYLSDYAFFVDGLLHLYEATFDKKWLLEAERLTDISIEYYLDHEQGGFFFTASDGEQLITRSKNSRDGAIPSGNSIQAHNLLRLSILLGRQDYREKAESTFRAFKVLVEKSPAAFERLLCAVDFYYGKPKEIAIVASTATALDPFVKAVYSHYLPNKVLIQGISSEPIANDSRWPLLRNKQAIDGKPTAYVCQNYACLAPAQSPAKLVGQLWPQP